MSAEAMGHVFRHSPYQGTSAEHAVLLAIADIANDANDNRLFLGKREIALKARVTERRVGGQGGALERLVADGWLELLREATPTETAEYRLVIDRDREVVWEPKRDRDRRAAAVDAASGVDAPSGGDATSGPDTASGGDATSVGEATPRRGGGDAASTELKRTQANPTGSASPRHVAVAGDGTGPPDVDLLTVELPDGTSVTVDLCSPGNSFNAWWKCFPRNAEGRIGGGGSPKKAREKWRRMNAAQRRAAFDALPHYVADLAASGRPVCMATTWLNEQRWEIYDGPPDVSLPPLVEALVTACGGDPDAVSGPARGDLCRAAAGLPDGTTDSQIGAVVKAWRKQWPGADPSPLAVVRHWHRFATQVVGRTSGPLCGHCGQPKASHDQVTCDLLRKAS